MPVSALIRSERAGAVRGPVATITAPRSGRSVFSSLTTLIRGWSEITSVTSLREPVPVDHEGLAARYGALIGRPQDKGAEQAKLCLQKTVSVRRLLRFQGIAANKLGEPIGLVGRRA